MYGNRLPSGFIPVDPISSRPSIPDDPNVSDEQIYAYIVDTLIQAITIHSKVIIWYDASDWDYEAVGRGGEPKRGVEMWIKSVKGNRQFSEIDWKINWIFTHLIQRRIGRGILTARY
jgi:hypothetical protein